MIDQETVNNLVKRIDFKLFSLEMTHSRLSIREKQLIREFLYDIKGDLITLYDFDPNCERKNHVNLIMKYVDTAINDLYFIKVEDLKRYITFARKTLLNVYKDVLQPKEVREVA